MSDPRGFKTAKTESGRTVIYCLCGGGPAHKWEPHGGGMRILACPHDAPEQTIYLTADAALAGAAAEPD